MLAELTLRQDYFGDPFGFQALTDLLKAVFGIDVGLLQRFGGPDPSSMPFGYFDRAGRCVANFSAFSMPLMINGSLVMAAGYQSGAVLPEFRGQGLYRNLMQQAFAWADASGFSTGILLTDKPSLYEAYGFRTLPQHRFHGPAPDVQPMGTQSRQLDLNHAADIAILSEILDRRQPVSNRFAVVRQKEMFLLNSVFDPAITLSLLPDLGIVIAWKRGDDGRLLLLDIAGPALPTMTEILSHLNQPADRIEVHFPTDRLGWEGTPMAYQGNCALMISGLAQDAVQLPLMLSPMADF
ncbi:GNAT family N-acetyltransferase [Rhizobium oryziradicis]|uniref:GNAT family N-acetyltransferase n=1 Tax=Rhizobium oryziradicis TaxID=1867956 RepID=A0A1Q8ZU04_9HYPH|nr:GNAT family N-acetyltransferase [Rhizobium oryziradicis]